VKGGSYTGFLDGEVAFYRAEKSISMAREDKRLLRVAPLSCIGENEP
jgi:hypothetical protein